MGGSLLLLSLEVSKLIVLIILLLLCFICVLQFHQFFYGEVDIGSLTCATILVPTVHTKTRQVVVSLHKY